MTASGLSKKISSRPEENFIKSERTTYGPEGDSLLQSNYVETGIVSSEARSTCSF